MPAVNAIKTLLMVDGEQTNKPNTPTPGICIRVVNVVQSPVDTKVIDVTPAEPAFEPEPAQPLDPTIFRVP